VKYKYLIYRKVTPFENDPYMRNQICLYESETFTFKFVAVLFAKIHKEYRKLTVLYPENVFYVIEDIPETILWE